MQSIKVCSLRRRRAGRLDEFVQVDPVRNPSGSNNEGLHERLEVVLLGIGHFDGRQLVLSRILAMNTDQGQSNVGTAPAEDFFHSCTRPGTSFSRVIKDSRSF